MPVTTRRRAAALSARRPSNLKGSPNSRSAISKQLAASAAKKPAAEEPARTPAGKVKGGKRRLKSLPENESALAISSQLGNRLYDGPAPFSADATTVSPTVLTRLGGLPQQAKFYHRKLGQVSRDLAASGERELFGVHLVLDRVLERLWDIAQRP